jgi:hypothetical protein
VFNVAVNHPLNQKELAEMLNNALQQIMPVYGSHWDKKTDVQAAGESSTKTQS